MVSEPGLTSDHRPIRAMADRCPRARGGSSDSLRGLTAPTAESRRQIHTAELRVGPIPRTGGGVDDDGNEAADDIEDNPSRPHRPPDRAGRFLVTRLAE